MFSTTLYTTPALAPNMQWLQSDVSTVDAPTVSVNAGEWHFCTAVLVILSKYSNLAHKHS